MKYGGVIPLNLWGSYDNGLQNAITSKTGSTDGGYELVTNYYLMYPHSQTKCIILLTY